MKKFITIILCLAIMLSLLGCNSESVTSTITIVENEDGTESASGVDSTTEGDDSSNQAPSQNESSQPSQPDTNSSNTSGTDGTDDIKIDYNTVVEIDICEDVIRGYLDATDPTTQYIFLSEYDSMVLDYQTLAVSWVPNGSQTYKLYLSENADFSNAYVTSVKGKYDNGNYVASNTFAICVPGKTYYWKVLGDFDDNPLGGGKIRIKNEPVRWIKIDGVSNVRDIGGWKTESGKTVNYGKIYRGAKLDDITDTGLHTLKALGIKTDIDIRSTASWDSYGAVERTGLNYHFIDTNAHYDHIFSSMGAPVEEVKTNYPEIFKLLADESNYPIYLHCNYGNDRTGSMAFILNGLLGVNYEDLTRDYELTSYAFSHDRRWRGDGIGGTFRPDDLIQHNISNSDVDGRWGMMNKVFMESIYCTDGKLSTAIEAYLLDAGVKQEHIDAYKRIMLG